jgi:predicted AlkP superfamily phosphohydrolase/phosphomutase
MKLAIIGIDALDPNLVERWRDDLPVLNGLIGRGTNGRLRSSYPPLSVPAWPTLYTGKQGGKHGVYGFTKREQDSYERVPVNYTDVRAESIWEALDTAGIRCGVMNVPLSYPPSELTEGFVVAGWPTPNYGQVCSRRDVLNDIESGIGQSYEVNPYPLSLEFDELSNDELYDRISAGLWHHQEAFEYVLQSYDLDVFFGVFMAIDIASHNFAWDRERLHEMYIEQDRAVGTLLESLSDETDTIVLSDHGHGARSSLSFHTNEWLRRAGYLSVQRDSRTGLLSRLGITQRNYVRIKNTFSIGDIHKRLPDRVYAWAKAQLPRGSEDSGLNPDSVHWDETTAYSGEGLSIHINDRQAHPDGTTSDPGAVIEEIKSDLQNVEHPETGAQLITEVGTRDELFSGPYLEDAPGLVFIPDEMRCNAPTGLADGSVFSDERWGEHRPYGVLVTAGPSFACRDSIQQRNITDVLPLILTALGEDIPEDVDGETPTERFDGVVKPTFRRSRDEIRGIEQYSGEESEQIREQLEGLGYLE